MHTYTETRMDLVDVLQRDQRTAFVPIAQNLIPAMLSGVRDGGGGRLRVLQLERPDVDAECMEVRIV